MDGLDSVGGQHLSSPFTTGIIPGFVPVETPRIMLAVSRVVGRGGIFTYYNIIKIFFFKPLLEMEMEMEMGILIRK
jgi:hypothetical protein